MTTQISDSLIYEGTPYQLVATSGGPLFDPNELGVATQELSSACWDGYYCTYAVEVQQLLLRDFHLGLSEADAQAADRGEGPVLLGRVPREDVRVIRREKMIDGHLVVREIKLSEGYFVDNLDAPWPFTGGLVIGHEYDRLRGVGNYGPSQPYEWKVLRELVVERGRILDVRTLDAEAAALRAQVTADVSLDDDQASLGTPVKQSLRFGFGVAKCPLKVDSERVVAAWANGNLSFAYARFEARPSSLEDDA